MTNRPVKGHIYNARISGIMPFGALAVLLFDENSQKSADENSQKSTDENSQKSTDENSQKIEGLIHISELSDEFTHNVSDRVSIGEKVQVKVLEETENGKIRLSIRQVNPDSKSTEERGELLKQFRRPTGGEGWRDRNGERSRSAPPRYRDSGRDGQRSSSSFRSREPRVHPITSPEVGATYKGKVMKNIASGAFVYFGYEKEGMVHISQISKARIDSVDSVLKVGDEVLVKFLGRDEKNRIRLSMRDADPHNVIGHNLDTASYAYHV